ncbi:DUF3105 domain-containing protein [Rhizomonospora bruguierae]|uniref:DUF3105 domain-containing protein n=1 Tax=Rhizomonospora bruguierae TaxID=1581705 RepID=UPI001BCC4E7E|nr:DUF3105 domain-containing protein [Micromonospora sp. NBRC 107566]
MSISTQGGGDRRPNVVRTGQKATPGGKPGDGAAKKPGDAPAKKAAGAKATGGKPGAKSAGKGGGPRRPIAPVKVNSSRPWGPIALFVLVGVIAVGIIGYGSWAVYQGARSWEDRAADIKGIANYTKTDPGMLTRDHKPGPQTYKVQPPVGGDHNNVWQNCMGDVYDAPIANEHAVHSLEHGAIWITYQPDLPKDQVDALAARVRGQEKMLMSPYPNLDAPISLQAWGYQLKVDKADDARIDAFIKALRVNASQEGPTALCNQGITATGTTPRDLPDAGDQAGDMTGAGAGG